MGNQHSAEEGQMPSTNSILATPDPGLKFSSKKGRSFSFQNSGKRSQSVRVSAVEQEKKPNGFAQSRRSTLSNIHDLRSVRESEESPTEEERKQRTGTEKGVSVIFTTPSPPVAQEHSGEKTTEKVSKPKRVLSKLSPWSHHRKVEESPKSEPVEPRVVKPIMSFEKVAKDLVTLSRAAGGGEKTISRMIFQNHVVPQSPVAERYLWRYFVSYKENSKDGLKSSEFVKAAEAINSLIIDKEQTSFYVKVYGQGADVIKRNAFIDLLISAYHLSSSSSGSFGPGTPPSSIQETDYHNQDFDGKIWIDAVTKSCFHIKEEMSIFFVTNWILSNLPRLLVPMHKYLLYQLTAGYARLTNASRDLVTQTEGSERSPRKTAETLQQGNDINPVLMWLLLSGLPQVYLNLFQKKPDSGPQQLRRLNSIDFMKKLINQEDETEQWSLLYDSIEHGLSVNRFQFHVFNYKGPTLMFVTCEEDYAFLVGADVEWRENCHFWGGEQSVVIQLKPEFRIEDTGPKALYANFAIRGYPFGLQMGRDPRKVVLEIKPDFEYVYFKKIPFRLTKIAVWGCAMSQAKTAQQEHKKWEAKEVEKQKKINLANVDWNDNPDKYLLELAGNYRSYTENK